MNIHAFRQAWLIAQQMLQLGVQRTRQCVGKGRQENASVGMGSRQVNSTVQCNNRLAGARRAGDARRAGVVALHPLL